MLPSQPETAELFIQTLSSSLSNEHISMLTGVLIMTSWRAVCVSCTEPSKAGNDLHNILNGIYVIFRDHVANRNYLPPGLQFTAYERHAELNRVALLRGIASAAVFLALLIGFFNTSGEKW